MEDREGDPVHNRVLWEVKVSVCLSDGPWEESVGEVYGSGVVSHTNPGQLWDDEY